MSSVPHIPLVLLIQCRCISQSIQMNQSNTFHRPLYRRDWEIILQIEIGKKYRMLPQSIWNFIHSQLFARTLRTDWQPLRISPLSSIYLSQFLISDILHHTIFDIKRVSSINGREQYRDSNYWVMCVCDLWWITISDYHDWEYRSIALDQTHQCSHRHSFNTVKNKNRGKKQTLCHGESQIEIDIQISDNSMNKYICKFTHWTFDRRFFFRHLHSEFE